MVKKCFLQVRFKVDTQTPNLICEIHALHVPLLCLSCTNLKIQLHLMYPNVDPVDHKPTVTTKLALKSSIQHLD